MKYLLFLSFTFLSISGCATPRSVIDDLHSYKSMAQDAYDKGQQELAQKDYLGAASSFAEALDEWGTVQALAGARKNGLDHQTATAEYQLSTRSIEKCFKWMGVAERKAGNFDEAVADTKEALKLASGICAGNVIPGFKSSDPDSWHSECATAHGERGERGIASQR